MPQINGQEIGPIGFGMMGFTWRANPTPPEEAFKTMKAALERGSNFWNAGEFYGPPEYNSLVLLEKYFAKYPEDADKVVLSVKGACGPTGMTPSGTPEEIRRSIDTCLKQLNGRKKIDIFECARRDPNVPMEVTFKAIQEYVDRGLVGGIALSEVAAPTIHEAVKHAKIVAVEVELSLFVTDVLENGVAQAAAQYGIPLVAYSPIGRGMLTGQYKKRSDIPADAMILHYPRFSEDNFDINVKLVHQVEALAKSKGCTPAQLSINWTIALARRKGLPKTIVPIPGSTTVGRVTENTVTVEITDEELEQIDATLAKFVPVGERYPPGIPVNT